MTDINRGLVDIKEVLDSIERRGYWEGNFASTDDQQRARTAIKAACREAGIKYRSWAGIFDSNDPDKPWIKVAVEQTTPLTEAQEKVRADDQARAAHRIAEILAL